MTDTALPVSIAVYSRFATVTPSDSVDLATIPDGIMVGATGNVQVNDSAGTQVVLTGLQAGQIYPFRVKRIWSTSTTATGITALYKGV